MGYIRHDAIVVTAWDEKRLSKARDKAKELNLPVTEIVDSSINSYPSFLIATDGSKEGWADSDAGDEAREAWKRWARKQAEEEELWIDWAHVNYGGDEPNYSSLSDHNGIMQNEERPPVRETSASPTYPNLHPINLRTFSNKAETEKRYSEAAIMREAAKEIESLESRLAASEKARERLKECLIMLDASLDHGNVATARSLAKDALAEPSVAEQEQKGEA